MFEADFYVTKLEIGGERVEELNSLDDDFVIVLPRMINPEGDVPCRRASQTGVCAQICADHLT